MDPYTDKENKKVNTKIPVPKAPLPALPQRLLKNYNDRPPLYTIAGPNSHSGPNRLDQNKQSLAGPSIAKNKLIGNRPNSPFKIDMKFVTVKRGCGEPIYNFIDCNDKTKIRSVPSVIYISSSDDEQDRNDSPSRNLSDKDLFSCRRTSASTPALQTLQPARVKNIKRSLKRPHSRELQGISPNQEKNGQNNAKRRLNFNQSVHERMLSPDYLQRSYMEIMDREYTSDVLSYLLQAEKKPPLPPRVRSETRACVINWLMKINGLDGNPATIQIAIWYLDSVLSSGRVALENMQLVAAASYWIATKILGPAMPASKLVRYSNNAFAVQRLLEAEKIILQRLKFPRQTVVAQDFLCYFAWWCNRDRPGQIEVAATFLCLCGMLVNKSLYQEYPSVVAAASIRNALLLLKKKELMPSLQSCTVFAAAERKASNISHTCAVLRHSVCAVASKNYGYKFIFEQYGMPPEYIAQTIVSAANELAVVDTRSSAAIF